MAHTMREVARRAGVSLATVSRVLNNTHYISEETRRRVLETVQEFNYFKNVHAKRLATGRSDLFGLVISEIAGHAEIKGRRCSRCRDCHLFGRSRHGLRSHGRRDTTGVL